MISGHGVPADLLASDPAEFVPPILHELAGFQSAMSKVLSAFVRSTETWV
jgi:hypothetical protein